MIRPLIPALILTLAACRENLSAPPTGTGPDLAGPTLFLSPGRDTTADSTGVLLIYVSAHDVSGVKRIDIFLLPARSSFPTITTVDTVRDVFYPVPLALFKHGALRYYVSSADILDHETVTDTVTVTVR